MHYFIPKRCPSSKKIMYATKQQALQAADQSERERGTNLWVYRCDYCATWHLTHNPPRAEATYHQGYSAKPRSRKRGYKPRRR